MRNNFPYVGAVYALLIQHHKVLLLKRANTGYNDGKRSVPAGHMDGGEFAHQALIRELSEEIGVQLAFHQLGAPLSLVRICHDGIDNERIEFFFPITQREGEIINNEPHKCDALEWFDLDNLPETTIPYIKTMIQQYLAGKHFVEINEKTDDTYSL